MADEQQQTPDAPDDDAPYAPPASGGDPDSRKRALKAQLAAAETTGDAETADELREQLDAVNKELATAERAPAGREAAAAQRRAAAETGATSATSPPQGRAAPAKATTTAKPKS